MVFNIETNRLKNIKIEVESSLIDYMQYSWEDSSLLVKYRHGNFLKQSVKRYEGVSQEQFFEMLNSDSVGKALLRLKSRIKPASSLGIKNQDFKITCFCPFVTQVWSSTHFNC
ncbi:hypothetical protein [Reichenbachiella sp.]|uniref:hypothetical protein n=1 Tax=Reichenbachiella sp. TaxID=2184521 RepID=UPI003BB1BD8B